MCDLVSVRVKVRVKAKFNTVCPFDYTTTVANKTPALSNHHKNVCKNLKLNVPKQIKIALTGKQKQSGVKI